MSSNIVGFLGFIYLLIYLLKIIVAVQGRMTAARVSGKLCSQTLLYLSRLTPFGQVTTLEHVYVY
jgi:hypothetical protein